MSRTPLRVVLAGLVAYCAWLAGCSDQPRDGYTWYKAVPALSQYEWHVIPLEDLGERCHPAAGTLINACIERHWGTDTCHVYSRFTELEARKFKPAGTFGKTTLFQHEVWDDPAKPTLGHCAGFDHKEPYLQGPPHG